MARYEDSAAAAFLTQVIEHTLALAGPQPEPAQHHQHHHLHHHQGPQQAPQHAQQGQQQGTQQGTQHAGAGGLSVRALANMLWACGKLGLSPGLSNLEGMLSRMQPLLETRQG